MSETLPFPVELYNELSIIIQRDIFFQIYTLTFPPLPRPDILRDKFYPVFKKIKTKLIFASYQLRVRQNLTSFLDFTENVCGAQCNKLMLQLNFILQ